MAIVRRLASIIILAVATLSGDAMPALTQDRATAADLSGVVFDQSNAVVPGTVVAVTNTATGVERKAVSNGAGRYAIPALPPGTYTIKAALAGFATVVKDDVVLTLGQNAQLDFTLAVGGTSESVTVTGASTPVDAHRTAVATVVSQGQIDSLPTNGRNFMSFSVITPGVNTDRTPQQGASATSGLTFAGQRARSNNITVDGLDNNDITTGSVRAAFSQEAVQEFQVLANSYSAEFGKASGGIVNIVTRSGANAVRGNIFTYYRHDALNAREHFEMYNPAGDTMDQGKAPYSQYQSGGTVGGPIRRNRSFFFFSAERLRVRANNFVNIDDTTPVIVSGRNYGTVVDILRRDGFPVEIGHVPYRVESDQALAKVDAVTSNHHVTFRLNWGDLLDENVEPWGGQVARSAGAYLDSRDLMGAASITSILSPRSVNELRLQVAYRDQNVVSLDPTCTGTCDQDDEGGPALVVGAIRVGRQFLTPQPRENIRYQVVDTVSHDAGPHHLKAGLDFSYINMPSVALPMTFGGSYRFQPLPNLNWTANQLLALGLPAAYSQGYGNPSSAGAYSDVSMFAEDDWRAADDLTVKLGVRYQNQYWPGMTERVAGLPPYGWPTDNNNVAPRLGASWNLRGDGKTSLHASYGVFYENHVTAIWGLPVLISGTPEHVRQRTVIFPNAVTGWQTPGRRLPEPMGSYPSLVFTIDPGLKTPYAHHASIGLERTFADGFAMSATFAYVRGFHQVGLIDYNPVIGRAPDGRPIRPLDGGVPGSSATVNQLTSWGESWYRGLMVSVGKRFGGRSQFLASYTLSKAEDTTTDYAFSGPQNVGFGRDPANPDGLPLGFEPDLERGPSLQDQRHRLVLSGVYAVGWGVTVSGIVTVGSGRPFNIIAGADLNRDGDTVSSDRPWTNPADPATAIGRNTGLLLGTSSVDLRVAKRLAVGGRARLDVMVEMFNVLNHTNYTQVDAVFGTGAYPDSPLPTFGQYTKAAPPFQAQLVVKLSF